MELRQLKAFLAVAEELHFGRAADYLGISQPPLSATIKALEAELQTTLFIRTTRSVTLTEEGEYLQKQLTPLLKRIDAVIEELPEVSAGIRGRLRVGYVSSASYSVLPAAVRKFHQLMPNVQLALKPLATSEQIVQLLAGEIDLAILRDHPGSSELQQEHILSEGLVAVVPQWHELAAHSKLDAAQLRDQPLILFPHELMPGYLSKVMAALQLPGSALNVVQRAIHQETVLGMVAAGVASSILPASVASIRMPGVGVIPLKSKITTSLDLAWHDARSPAAALFSQCVHEVAAAKELSELMETS